MPVVAFLTLGIFLVNGFASGIVSAVSGNGGGLFVGSSATASIQSGMTFKGCSATNGGGVYVSSGGTLNMTGGSVSGNSASENGNNIYNAGTFTMTGGTVQSVSSNKAVRVDANGNPSSTGNYVLFGSYPQSHQTDTSVITSSKDSNGYYLGTDGNRYAKMVATVDNKFQDGTTITKGSTYYFKVEPIKWRILSSTSGQMMLLCDQIVDSKWWDDDVSYTNSYVNSEIRAFLNGYSTTYGSSYYNNGFLQTAFTSKEQNYIQTTTVDNSVSTMNDSNVLTSETNTKDKIFLLSYKDLINTSYGFSSNTDSDSLREVLSTDFARAVGSYASGDYTAGSAWWARSRANYSAGNNSTNYATMVTYQGLVVFLPVNEVLGVIPVLNLSTSAFDMKEYGIYNTGTMNLYGGTIDDNVYSSTTFNTKMNATINGTITLGDSATITVKDYAGTTPSLNISLSSSRSAGTILTLQGSSTTPDLTNLSITGYDSSKFKVSSSQNSSGEWEITLTQTSYKIELKFGGGIQSLARPGSPTAGSTISIEATPYSGYSFSYWDGFPDDIEFVSGCSKYSRYCFFIMPEKDLVLTAYATPNTYTITLNNQSATTSGTSTIYEKYATGYYSNSSATTSIKSITVPTKTGYTFGGYYTSTGGSGTQIITSTGSISIGNTYFASSTTIYAYWISNVYTITLNNQSATSAGTTTIYEKYGVGYYSNSSATTSITSITVPTKTGYTFGGYYTSTGGSGTQIITSTGSISASNTKFTSNTTLYAKWVTETYNIVFNTTGGSSMSLKTYSKSSSSQNVSFAVPTKSGYIFSYWQFSWTDSNHSSSVPTISNSSVTIPANCYGNITLTAVWTQTSSGGSEEGNTPGAGPSVFPIGFSEGEWMEDLAGRIESSGIVSSISDIVSFAIITPTTSHYIDYTIEEQCEIYNDIYIVKTTSPLNGWDTIAIYCYADIGFSSSGYKNTTFLMEFENLEYVDFTGFGTSQPLSFRLPDLVHEVYTVYSNNVGYVKNPGETSFSVYCCPYSVTEPIGYSSSQENSEYFIPGNQDIVYVSDGVANVDWDDYFDGTYTELGLVFASLLSPEIYENYVIEKLFEVSNDLYFARFEATNLRSPAYSAPVADYSYGFITNFGLLSINVSNFASAMPSNEITITDFRGLYYVAEDYIYIDEYSDVFGYDALGAQFVTIIGNSEQGYNMLEQRPVAFTNDKTSANLEINDQIQAVLDDEKKRYFVLKEQDLDDDVDDGGKND